MTVREINLNHFRMKLASVGLNIHGYNRPHVNENVNDPDDVWDYREDSRIQTPYDKDTGRLSRILGDAPLSLPRKEQGSFYDLASDDVYGDFVDTRLDKTQLSQVADYLRRAQANPKFKFKEDINPYLKKIEHLQNDPTMHYARMEWE